eukprot:6443540-Pyramimonas_sp.AAC.1
MRTPPRRPSVEVPMGQQNAELGGETHANIATEAFGSAPYGATKRCTGRGKCMRTLPLGPS